LQVDYMKRSILRAMTQLNAGGFKEMALAADAKESREQNGLLIYISSGVELECLGGFLLTRLLIDGIHIHTYD
jgi:hypothetical protein